MFIPRRDSSSRLNVLAGGRLFPGMHHHACFQVNESAQRLSVAYASDDGQAQVQVTARISPGLPAGSVFASLEEASQFFADGSLGYSVTATPTRYDGLELRCKNWAVQPLAVESVQSSYFDNPALFPSGSATLDCALLMRGIEHQWHSRADLCCPGPA